MDEECDKKKQGGAMTFVAFIIIMATTVGAVVFTLKAIGALLGGRIKEFMLLLLLCIPLDWFTYQFWSWAIPASQQAGREVARERAVAYRMVEGRLRRAHEEQRLVQSNDCGPCLVLTCQSPDPGNPAVKCGVWLKAVESGRTFFLEDVTTLSFSADGTEAELRWPWGAAAAAQARLESPYAEVALEAKRRRTYGEMMPTIEVWIRDRVIVQHKPSGLACTVAAVSDSQWKVGLRPVDQESGLIWANVDEVELKQAETTRQPAETKARIGERVLDQSVSAARPTPAFESPRKRGAIAGDIVEKFQDAENAIPDDLELAAAIVRDTLSKLGNRDVFDPEAYWSSKFHHESPQELLNRLTRLGGRHVTKQKTPYGVNSYAKRVQQTKDANQARAAGYMQSLIDVLPKGFDLEAWWIQHYFQDLPTLPGVALDGFCPSKARKR